MKKNIKKQNTLLGQGILFSEVRSLILLARKAAVQAVDTLQVITNFEIGRRIVEHEQQGTARAQYGKQLLLSLSKHLTKEFGRGFSHSNLEYMRKFYLLYQDRFSKIRQMPSIELIENQKIRIVPDKSKDTHVHGISQMSSGKFRKSVFSLSWSQYIFLISIKDGDARSFYEIEASNNGWTLPELTRQFNSSLYERLALSRNKKEVKQLSRKGQIIEKPDDMLKNSYVLEFLGLDEKPGYSETDLETAIINKLESFLLELGKGFLFEARQKRFTFDEDHFFVDLVFYNRLLRSYVLIDLKIGKLTHQDLGQMQMYVNYFDRYVKTKEEKSTIGIILCRKKREALVEITLSEGANIHAKEYKLYLPSKVEFKKKLIEWTNNTD